jgi:hypothetical protein
VTWRTDNTATALRRAWLCLLALLVTSIVALPALAGPREQARRMHDRLVGIPPSETTLQAMTSRIAANDALGAADLAMQDPAFYNVALKNWVTPWTNVAGSAHAPLNDFTATVIGLIRDGRPFNSVLTADTVYVAPATLVETPYQVDSNDHYEELEEIGADLSDPAVLVRSTQSAYHPELSANDAAGVMTLRASAEAFLSAGTNRRLFRFVSKNFMCRDMEALHDVTRATDRIRQDVTRAPGGDSSVFLNQCTGCHSGMDPMAQAFANLNWDDELEQLVYTPGTVQAKYFSNAGVFPMGYVTPDERWTNHWREGPNAALGWPSGTPGEGFGAKTLGAEIANSRAFSVCQVEKALEAVCLRPVSSAEDRTEVSRIADVFEAQQYDMKRVFGEVAVWCMGE